MRVDFEFGWDEFFEAALHGENILAGGDFGAIRYSKDMRIHCDCRFAKCRVEHHIGCFATDAGKRLERLACAWYLAGVLL